MLKKNIALLIIAFASTVLAVYWQESNLSFLCDLYPSQNGMITTADEASYFQPPSNFLDNGKWKDNSIGTSSFVQRPPGYGMIFLVCKTISPDNAFILLKLFQILCYYFLLFFLGKLFTITFDDERTAIIALGLFGLLPCYSGFMYYTLTESITPFLLTTLVYAYMRSIRSFKNSHWWFSLLTICVLLIRPQLMIFPLLFGLHLLYLDKRKIVAVAIAFIPLLLWQVRTFNITGLVTLHPIYSYTNGSIYRPPHQTMTELFKVWEYRSDRFHETIGYLVSDTSLIQREKALNYIPEKFRPAIEELFTDFQQVTYAQKQYMDTCSSVLVPLEIEKRFVDKVQLKTKSLSRSYLLDAYLVTPFKSSVELIKGSHLNLAIFQQKFRGNMLMETLRWICRILIVFSLLTLVIMSGIRSLPAEMRLLSLGAVLLVLYLVFVQRLNEERYLTPILPLAYFALVYLVHKKRLIKRPALK